MNVILSICTLVGIMSLGSYLIPMLIQSLLPTQNFKTKYAPNGQWGVVTGGSSGIGEAIATKLAKDGINLVIVALDDHLLTSAVEKLRAYPIQVRSVGVDLSRDFMPQVIQATQDIQVTLLFNNAGYIKPGLFTAHSIESIMANVTVNASCVLPITHYFANKMTSKGLICFTSSSGGFVPSPMGSIYASTKAFLTFFGVSFAAEVKGDNIDTVVVHPSPIASNFYQNANGMSALASAQKAAQHPCVIADVIWKNAGRFTVVDQGFVSVFIKLILKVVDWNVLGELMVRFVWVNDDYQRFHKMALAKKEE